MSKVKTTKQIIKLSSSMRLNKLIKQYGIREILNDLLYISEMENDMKNEKYPKGGHFSYHLKKKMNLKKFIIELDNHVI